MATARVVLNRQAADQLLLAMADGLFAVAEEVLRVVVVPDAPPFGQGLQEGGGAIAYVGPKKVAGTTIGGRQISKPRAMRTKVGEVAAAVGFGFPGRFEEIGTVDTAANPFLTRGVFAVIGGNALIVLSEATKRRLAGFRK